MSDTGQTFRFVKMKEYVVYLRAYQQAAGT
jgi:hypothetical protein